MFLLFSHDLRHARSILKDHISHDVEGSFDDVECFVEEVLQNFETTRSHIFTFFKMKEYLILSDAICPRKALDLAS